MLRTAWLTSVLGRECIPAQEIEEEHLLWEERERLASGQWNREAFSYTFIGFPGLDWMYGLLDMCFRFVFGSAIKAYGTTSHIVSF